MSLNFSSFKNLIIWLFVFALFSLIVFALQSITHHPVDNIRFKNPLSQAQKQQLIAYADPELKKGYYIFKTTKLEEKLESIAWVAKAKIVKSPSFGIEIDIEKEQVVFLYNQLEYLNQYLEIKKIENLIPYQKIQSNLVHIYSTNDKLDLAINFYNKLTNQLSTLEKIPLELTELKVNNVDQIKLTVLYYQQNEKNYLELNLGREKISQRMTQFTNNFFQIIAQVLDLKNKRGFKDSVVLVDLRFPKGFSVELI